MTPSELFSLYFDNDIKQLIIEQSEQYARQHSDYNFTLTESDLNAFIGIILLSGYHSLHQEHLYWSRDDDVGVPLISGKMSRSRFREIKRFFHLADNQTLDKRDKLSKLRPFLKLVEKNLLQFGVFSPNLSLDEQMVPYFGRHSLRMYMKGKPIKFGMKVWILASDDGYPFSFDVYTGRSAGESGPLGKRVVDKLTRCLEKKSSHTLYFDRFFSSTALCRKLADEGLRSTGTVQMNRIENCPLTPSGEFKRETRGTYEFYNDSKVSVCQWVDSRPVAIVTNHDLIDPPRSARRWSSKSKKVTQIPMPQVFGNYNLHMGGVDLLDRFLSDYRPRLRSKKWWWCLLSNFLNMFVVASWRIHKSCHGTLSHLEFRRKISPRQCS